MSRLDRRLFISPLTGLALWGAQLDHIPGAMLQSLAGKKGESWQDADIVHGFSPGVGVNPLL
jgi:hypothetical protein